MSIQWESSNLIEGRPVPKIIFVTIPLRSVPADFPPIGSLSVITALKKAGFAQTHFYNIDLLRPTYSEVIEYFEREKPDIVGISAVVSTAYEYVKNLSLDLKDRLPGTTLLLGGNLGASAEILLKKTGMDFVCIGEGERTAVDFVHCWLRAKDKGEFSNVKGLAFLNDQRELEVTPYADPIPAEELYDIDWSILEDLGQLKYHIVEADLNYLLNSSFRNDPRIFEPQRQGKTIVTLPSIKGCVARCTFCHRWDKSIRFIPVPLLMQRLDYFIEKYNAGFVSVAAENFGTDKKWLGELIDGLKERDVLWKIGGMRVSDVTADWIRKMRDGGCSQIIYGMESGSQRILDIMEKKTTAEQNRNAVKWMVENKVHTTLQLVIGMPGESPETIAETAEFAAYFAEQSPDVDPNDLSINFAQALPGTPLYEFGRRIGSIGQTLNEEEKYLFSISNRDARDGETYINFTDYPQLMVEQWQFEISSLSRYAYVKKWGWGNYRKILLNASRLKYLSQNGQGSGIGDSGYFAEPARMREQPQNGDSGSKDETGPGIPSLWNLIRRRAKVGHIAMFYPRFFHHGRKILVFLVLINVLRKYGGKKASKVLFEYLQWKIKNILPGGKHGFSIPYISLRKLTEKNLVPSISTDSPAMVELRKGR